jgi:hypothetical protein
MDFAQFYASFLKPAFTKFNKFLVPKYIQNISNLAQKFFFPKRNNKISSCTNYNNSNKVLMRYNNLAQRTS